MSFGYEREISEPEAELWLPLEEPSPLGVSMRLGGAAGSGTVELLVNGQSLGAGAYSASWDTLKWPAPAAAWTDGFNRVTLRATPRVAGGTLPRVRRITLTPPGLEP